VFRKGAYVRMKLAPNTRMGTVGQQVRAGGTSSTYFAPIRDFPVDFQMKGLTRLNVFD
jgi:hypothetical protein